MVESLSIKFPYYTKTIDESKIPDPRALIKVDTLKGPRLIKFLIDSGADTTVLPLARYGPSFKIDVSPKNKTEDSGIAKDSFYVRCIFLESSTTPLLGRLDIWSKYSLLFDDNKKESVFHCLLKV